ncbi:MULTISPECIES: cytochrome C oxidase subunit IV family protein [unclassified Rhizobium]|uniref:cytochrome C oxidase subunit IV family protein n=1 Tax=unclassified Rhizobium TaxID=2613769 RepID=UPI0006FF6C7D|nr:MULTISPECIES: cytochrome C oxidase subunit IV family protein [unclassified Rhizobium]KQV39947.1 hypothetical protein ASC86_22135 [Rhizobium sp. Root1212]KRD31657.1 hypothetical protein ASE37_23180 [Rhizobium sp. Root268]
MAYDKDIWLLGRAIGVILVAIVSGLVAAQWKHEAVPFVAFAIILLLAVVKSRWIVLDFMGLRGVRPRLAIALLAWPAFFVIVAAARTALATFGIAG